MVEGWYCHFVVIVQFSIRSKIITFEWIFMDGIGCSFNFFPLDVAVKLKMIEYKEQKKTVSFLRF